MNKKTRTKLTLNTGYKCEWQSVGENYFEDKETSLLLPSFKYLIIEVKSEK